MKNPTTAPKTKWKEMEEAWEELKNARENKVKADAEVELAMKRCTALLLKMTIEGEGDETTEQIRGRYKGKKVENLGGLKVGQEVKRVNNPDGHWGIVLSLHPDTGYVRAKFPNRDFPGNYKAKNLRKVTAADPPPLTH